jgi:hypothetical protein
MLAGSEGRTSSGRIAFPAEGAGLRAIKATYARIQCPISVFTDPLDE